MASRRKRRSDLDRNLYLRGGVWYTRIGDDRNTTGCPRIEVAAARAIRDHRLGEAAKRKEPGLIDKCPKCDFEITGPADTCLQCNPPLPPPLLFGELIDSYMDSEAREYDREGPLDQPGTKRSRESDEGCIVRLFGRPEIRNRYGTMIAKVRHGHAKRSASAAIDTEALLELAGKVERETPRVEAATRKKFFRFLSAVYTWAEERPRQTGIKVSPFKFLSKEQRRRLFPKGRTRKYIYSPDQLRSLWELLPCHAMRAARFALYTGVRKKTVYELRKPMVNLAERKFTVRGQRQKGKRDYEIPLGDVALSIIEPLMEANSDPNGYVFLGKTGKPLKNIDGAFVSAVKKVWTPSKPGEERPRFHDLRKTAATRIESVASHAVARRFLQHADGDVTDTYIDVSLDELRDKINMAARSIDVLAPPPGTIPFPVAPKAVETTHQTAHPPESAVGSAS